MIKCLFKKGLVIGILILFIGLSIIPTISGNIKDLGLQHKNNQLINTYIADDLDDRSDFNNAYSNHDNIMPDVKPLARWDFWPDLPGRYEPMFDVHDIIEYDQTAWGLTSADFNNDGLLDFVASWATAPWTQSTISIFYNDNEGGFTQEDLYTITEPEATYFIDLNSGDYDLDGDIDILFTYNEYVPWSYTNGTVNLLFNDGNNNFNECIMIARLVKTEDGEKRINPTITSNDFDDDGDLDFLIGDNSGLVEFYKNDGTGNFISAGVYDFGGGMSWGLSSADFDDDGDLDFIVTQNENSDTGYIYLIWNDGTTSCFNQSNHIIIAELPPLTSFFIGRPILGWGYLQSIDYNNDEMMDFIFGSSDSVFLYMQKDIGVFDYFHIMRLPGVADKEEGGWFCDDLRNGGIAIGDFNGDDLEDMVIGGVQGFVRICYNKFVLVDIVHPDSANLFLFNIKVWQISPLMIYRFLKYGISVVIGDLTVEAKALEPLQKVEFYLSNKLMYTDDSEPFEWKWDRFSFRRCKIKAVGYDLDGNKVGFDDAIVWKFF
jgi:hypothetical protein